MPRTDFWSDEETAALRRMTSEGMSDNEMARRLDRTPYAVASKRKKCGIPSHYVCKQECHWSDEDVALLTANIRLTLEKLVPLFPGRDRRQIDRKRYILRRDLGIRKYTFASNHPDGFRRRVFDDPKPIVEEHAPDPRPLWVPFVTASGIRAIRTEAGVVPFVTLIHEPGHDASSLPA